MDRQGIIGGTDAIRIMNGEWLELYQEKVGLTKPEDLSDYEDEYEDIPLKHTDVLVDGGKKHKNIVRIKKTKNYRKKNRKTNKNKKQHYYVKIQINLIHNSKQQEEFAEILRECGKSIDDSRDKVIKKLCDNVYLDKE